MRPCCRATAAPPPAPCIALGAYRRGKTEAKREAHANAVEPPSHWPFLHSDLRGTSGAARCVSQSHAITHQAYLALLVLAPLRIVNAIAVADIEPIPGAVPPDRV